MRILLPTLYDTHGGSTRVLLAAAAALDGPHDVIIRAPIPEAQERTNPRFRSRPLVGPWRKLAALPVLSRLILTETMALRRLRPDLIHVHDEPSLYVYGLAARLIRPRPFLLWHRHAPGSGNRSRVAALADACIVISPHAEPSDGLPWRLVRNPLPDLPPPSPPTDLEAQLAGLAVVGAIDLRKGQDRAVEAFAALVRRPGTQAAHLMLIGPVLDPAFANVLRARIASLGLTERVRFTGLRAADAAFSGVGLALFPSRSEMQPLALAEAMARGLPVVASDIPAHRAMLEDVGADPASLAGPDPEHLADAILKAAREAPSPALAQRTRALFASERFSADLRAAIKDLMAERSRRTAL